MAQLGPTVIFFVCQKDHNRFFLSVIKGGGMIDSLAEVENGCVPWRCLVKCLGEADEKIMC